MTEEVFCNKGDSPNYRHFLRCKSSQREKIGGENEKRVETS